MADALLGNWDVVGLSQDNVLWDGPTPYRVDQGGTLEFRAQGGRKEFGPVPQEVWTMSSPKGQAHGTMLLTPSGKREQASEIAARLTPERVDELVDAAPFADAAMRERVRENLKARVGWMGRFGAGLEPEPGPPTGEAASKAFLAGQRLELRPEQATALAGLVQGYDAPVNEPLRSGRPAGEAHPAVRFVVDHVDSLLGAARAPVEFRAYAALPGPPSPGSTLREKGYLFATLDEGEARRAAGPKGTVLRVLVGKGARALFVPGVAGQLEGEVPDEPQLVLERGARVKVSMVEDGLADGALL
jgi:hypothetical protein